jgi:hypothetical protein
MDEDRTPKPHHFGSDVGYFITSGWRSFKKKAMYKGQDMGFGMNFIDLSETIYQSILTTDRSKAPVASIAIS